MFTFNFKEGREREKGEQEVYSICFSLRPVVVLEGQRESNSVVQYRLYTVRYNSTWARTETEKHYIIYGLIKDKRDKYVVLDTCYSDDLDEVALMHWDYHRVYFLIAQPKSQNCQLIPTYIEVRQAGSRVRQLLIISSLCCCRRCPRLPWT